MNERVYGATYGGRRNTVAASPHLSDSEGGGRSVSHEKISARIRPQRRLVLAMHPHGLIPKDADGGGGGIRLMVTGEAGVTHFVDVVWGRKTEIEVAVES